MRILAKFFVPALTIVVFSAPAVADEVVAGTVIQASTIDALTEQTFEGHRIGDLVPPGLELLVRKYDLKIPLRHSESIPKIPKIAELSSRYSGQVRYDKATRMISGYVAGEPFPDVQRDAMAAGDPEIAATKLMWNFFLVGPLVSDNYINNATIYNVVGKSLERTQGATDRRLRTIGRLSEPHTIGDGLQVKRQITMILSPYDARGVGVFYARYFDGRPDDAYAYIKSVRRLRRLSGGVWNDSVAGTTLFNEDSTMLDVHPTWYQRYNLLGESTVLAIAHGPDSSHPHEVGDRYDLKGSPWNPINVGWEPVKTYVIEATPPSFHLYGKKIVYMFKDFPTFHLSDVFDRQGNRWKVGVTGVHPVTPTESPHGGIYISYLFMLDVQHDTASFIDFPEIKDDPGFDLDKTSLGAVQTLLR